VRTITRLDIKVSNISLKYPTDTHIIVAKGICSFLGSNYPWLLENDIFSFLYLLEYLDGFRVELNESSMSIALICLVRLSTSFPSSIGVVAIATAIVAE
jgi:hypothetical protein